ncbi:MAG: APC family permease [Actinobacteria bacterium]|nr:APC family permease [Actinomycetota bacterium]
MPSSTDAAAGPLFSRRATGLVRELSTFDAFVLCFSAVAIPIGITQAFLFAPQLFPGVNMAWSFAVAAVVALVFGLVYLYYTRIMPQSGGDYVWVSRVLHPAIGFAVGSVSTFTPLQFSALNLAVQTTIFVPAFAAIMGHSNLVMSQTTTMIVAAVATLVIGAVLLSGVRWVARISTALFALVIVGMLIWLFLLLVRSPAHFQSAWNASSQVSYDAVIAKAEAKGFDTSPNLSSTLLGVVFGFQFFVGFQWMAFFAGEVRKASRVARTAILGTWAVTATAFIAGSILVYHYYGYKFLAAAGFLFSEEPETYALPVPPYVSSLVPYLTGSKVLQYVIVASFIAAIAWSSLTFFMVASRNIFAWSFDGIVPEALSKVNKRTHVPVWSVVLVTLLVLLVDYLTIYTEFFGLLVNWVAVICSAVVVVATSLVLLPVIRPRIWERAPADLRQKWFGVYKVQVIGVLAAVSQAAIVVIALTTPTIGGKVTVKSLIYAFAVPAIAFAWYWAMRAYRRSRGVQLENVFAEIPGD